MSLFRNWTKKAVETVKDVTAEVTTEAASDKLDIWGDIALVGIFAIVTGGALRRNSKKVHDDIPDARSITINNYYYRDPKGRK